MSAVSNGLVRFGICSLESDAWNRQLEKGSLAFATEPNLQPNKICHSEFVPANSKNTIVKWLGRQAIYLACLSSTAIMFKSYHDRISRFESTRRNRLNPELLLFSVHRYVLGAFRSLQSFEVITSQLDWSNRDARVELGEPLTSELSQFVWISSGN